MSITESNIACSWFGPISQQLKTFRSVCTTTNICTKPVTIQLLCSTTSVARSPGTAAILQQTYLSLQIRTNATQNPTLVLEFTILVLPKKCCPHARKRFDLKQLKSFVEGVVDVDLARAIEDDNTSRTIQRSCVSMDIPYT
jgi:hypothetical protein